MNRKIICRAWYPKSKEFITRASEMADGDDGYVGSSCDDEAVYSDMVVWQQFTGASDRNDKEIFEGDIVLWNNPDPYDGEDFLTKVVGYNNRTMGYRLYSFPEEIGKAAGASFFPEDVEVIGNIFEGASKDGVDYGSWRLK